MKPSRLPSIDALRGIASLAVCWFHMTNGYAADSLVRSSGHYGWLGVEVFFVLSGFIIPFAMFSGGYTVRTGWKTFISKRFLRIEPPYLLAILLVFALWHASSMAPGFKGSPPPDLLTMQTLLHVGYLAGIAGYPWLNVVFWTLAIEFQFYLLVSLIFGGLSHKTKHIVLLMNLSLLFTSLVLSSELFVFKYLGLFMLGIVAFQYQAKLVQKRMMAVLLFAATVVTWMTLGWMVALVGSVTSCLIVSGVTFGRHKLVVWLGAISYSLYLVHVPIGGRVVNLGRRYVESQIGELFLSLLALGGSLVAAYAFYLVIERPSQRLAARLKYSSPAIQHIHSSHS